MAETHLVQCANCGKKVQSDEALRRLNQSYCSEECARLNHMK